MRKALKHFVIFFLIGAIINLAVAWSWILFVPVESAYINYAMFGARMPNTDDVIKKLLPQYVFVRSDLNNLNEYEFNNRGYKYNSVFGRGVDIRGVKSVVTLYERMEAGWPLCSFDGEYFMTPDGLELSFMFRVQESMFDYVEYHHLPFKPKWPGFAINTALYGGVPWLLICGPFILRRHRRRKRKQCVGCGYPKGESEICTECGSPLPVIK